MWEAQVIKINTKPQIGLTKELPKTCKCRNRKMVVKRAHTVARYLVEVRGMLRKKLDKSEKSIGTLRRAGLQAEESRMSHGSESRSQCWGYHG